MPELMEETRALESTTIGIYRTATVVKGGRRFSFSSMVVVGDRHGSVGLGYGKGRGVPVAIEKAEKNARKAIHKVTLKEGTLPHPVIGRFGASVVKLVPASPGTGVIAGGTVRAVLEMVGVRDCLTKSYGSSNQKNLSKATLDGLMQLRSKDEVAGVRGVDMGSSVVEEILEAGRRYAPKSGSGEPKAQGPINTVRVQRGGGRGGRGGRGGGGRGRGGAPQQPQVGSAGATPIASTPVTPAAPQAEQPAAPTESPSTPPES